MKFEFVSLVFGASFESHILIKIGKFAALLKDTAPFGKICISANHYKLVYYR